MLRRLAYPNRLCDLELLFERSAAGLSEIIEFVNRHICDTFGHLLEDINNLVWLNEERMQLYAQVDILTIKCQKQPMEYSLVYTNSDYVLAINTKSDNAY